VPDLYDVAFSFLAEDEPTARALSEKLAGRISTFVFSERQRDLAGCGRTCREHENLAS